MRRNLHAFVLVLLGGMCYSQTYPTGISDEEAIRIALAAAGCKKAEDCIVRGGPNNGKWVFTVSLIAGRDSEGKPLFTPGGWVGITLDSQGHVIEEFPGD